jgi:hypothetical protein
MPRSYRARGRTNRLTRSVCLAWEAVSKDAVCTNSWIAQRLDEVHTLRLVQRHERGEVADSLETVVVDPNRRREALAAMYDAVSCCGKTVP